MARSDLQVERIRRPSHASSHGRKGDRRWTLLVVYEYRDFFVISYSPDDRGYEGVLAIRASANGVLLYFNHAKDLPDPAKLLKGSGTQARSIDVEGASTLARPEVVGLIDEAIARNSVPFEIAGRGSVVIRSTSAKKRRQRRPA